MDQKIKIIIIGLVASAILIPIGIMVFFPVKDLEEPSSSFPVKREFQLEETEKPKLSPFPPVATSPALP